MCPVNVSPAPIGNWSGKSLLAEPAPNHVQAAIEIGPTRSILLAKMIAARHSDRLDATRFRSAAQPPPPNRARLTAPSSTPEGALYFGGEVDMAGGVDDVDAVSRSLWVQKQVVAAEVIVIPRSCSCSIQSIVAAPSWTSPIL